MRVPLSMLCKWRPSSDFKGQLLRCGPLRQVFFRAIQEWLIAVWVSEEGALFSESAVCALAFRDVPTAGVRLCGKRAKELAIATSAVSLRGVHQISSSSATPAATG